MSLHTLCRVCARRHLLSNLVDIFKTCNSSDTIAEMVTELTGLKVEKDDGLPSFCCIQCQLELFSSIETRRKCLNSVVEIRAMLANNLVKLEVSDPLSLDCLDGKASETSELQNIYCTTFQECFEDVNTSREHTESVDQDIQISDPIPVGRDVQELTDLIDQSIEFGTASKSCNAPNPDKAKAMKCNFWFSLYNMARAARRNRAAMNPSKPCGDTMSETRKPKSIQYSYKCSACNRSFVSKSEKMKHDRSVHVLNEPTSTGTGPTTEKHPLYHCAICGKQSRYKADLVDHEDLHKKASLYGRTRMRSHEMRKHDTGAEHVCRVCGKTSKTYTNLKVEKDDGLPSVCCIHCKSDLASSIEIRRKCINSAESLTSIIRDDSLQTAVPESSELCNKDGSNDKHNAFGSDVEPHYGCTKCQEHFADIRSLNEHMEAYHGEKTASRSINITAAMCLDIEDPPKRKPSKETDRTDNTIKPPHSSYHNHQCCGCSLRFNTENELMEHSRLVHATNPPLPDKSKPFQCNICYRWVETEDGILRHRNIVRNRQVELSSSGMQQRYSPTLELAVESIGDENDSDGDSLDNMNVSEMSVSQNYQCDECNECFVDMKSLREHSAKFHDPEKAHHETDEHSTEMGVDSSPENTVDSWDEDTSEMSIANELQESDDRNYRCCGCSQGFDTENELMEHSQSIHALNAPLPDESKPIQCNICYGWYKTKRNVRDHQFYMRNRRFKCTICDMQFGRASGLVRHKNTHDKALIFPCQHCGKLFATVYRRLIHEKKEHALTGSGKVEMGGEQGTEDPNQKNHACCGCILTFGNEDELLEHSRSVHGPNAPLPDENKAFQCNICYRRYKTDRAVRIHQHAMRNRLLQCASCGKKFSSPSHLADHENVHAKALIFPCVHCGEKFHNKTARYMHVKRTHTTREADTSQKHVCSVCGKFFNSADYLKQHMSLHAEDTPHKCRCGAQFKLKVYLARHMKIHSGQYTCKYCSAAYPCASLLRDHENRHTDNKEFSCEICGKQFYGKADVRKHRQKVHEKRRRRVKASTR